MDCWSPPFGHVDHILPTEESLLVLDVMSVLVVERQTEANNDLLRIFKQFWSIGDGSLSSTITRKSRTWTRSYFPHKSSGGSSYVFHIPSLTLLGSQASGGYPTGEMSNPSSCVVAGKVFARSRSQILVTKAVKFCGRLIFHLYIPCTSPNVRHLQVLLDLHLGLDQVA